MMERPNVEIHGQHCNVLYFCNNTWTPAKEPLDMQSLACDTRFRASIRPTLRIGRKQIPDGEMKNSNLAASRDKGKHACAFSQHDCLIEWSHFEVHAYR